MPSTPKPARRNARPIRGERQEGVAGGGGKIAQVRGVLAGYDQHVRRSQRKDVQQDDEMLVLEESVRRLAATRYGAEHAIHGKSRHRPRLMLNACRA